MNEIDLFKSFNAFRNITIFLGCSALLLGTDFIMTIYFRRFLGREQIRLQDKKVRLREVELYHETLVNMQA